MSTDSDIQQAERYLDVVAHHRTAGGLERMRWICAQLGDPQVGAPTVHITGTNGKGSTARLAAALLHASGRRTGLYTSPHLVHVGERVLIDGEPLPPEEFARAVLRLRPILDRVSEQVSFGPARFEVFTALALQLFTGLDARVIEVGIGGRLDPTNVVDAEVAVLTNIDLDHVEYLGRERSTIAADKAGIIKSRATAISGPMPPELTDIVARRCAEVGATLWAAGRDYALDQQPRPGGRTLTVRTPGRTYRDLDIPFRGAHQAENAACALAAVEALVGPLPEDLVRSAWADVPNPGRFEVFPGEHPIVVDVAHNPHGIAALTAQLAEEFAGRDAIVVIGTNRHKDVTGMLERLRPYARAIIATQATKAPSLPAEDLAAIARTTGLSDVEAVTDPRKAVEVALARAGDLVVCTGSHYWIGQVYPELRALA